MRFNNPMNLLSVEHKAMDYRRQACLDLSHAYNIKKLIAGNL